MYRLQAPIRGSRSTACLSSTPPVFGKITREKFFSPSAKTLSRQTRVSIEGRRTLQFAAAKSWKIKAFEEEIPGQGSLSDIKIDVAVSVIKEHIEKLGECNLLKATPAVEEAVNALIKTGAAGGLASESIVSGAGVWEVFYMPHIRRIAEPLGISFKPLRYSISQSGEIASDVQYDGGSIPLLGKNWLSSGGVVRAKNADAVEIVFDSFWVGTAPGGGPRADPGGGGGEEDKRRADVLINVVGKAAFVEGIASFPVLYFSDDANICVFRFPPLNSAVAAYRVAPPPGTAASSYVSSREVEVEAEVQDDDDDFVQVEGSIKTTEYDA